MLNSVVILSVMATAVMAQGNPLIPSGISQSCTDFLTSLNSDSGIQSCAQSFVSATQAYAPGSSSANPGAASMTSSLNTLCSSSDSCPDSLISGKLTDFYSKCNAELTSNPNNDVRRTYDVLYILSPMKRAVCSKDDDGKYCVTETTTSSSAGNSLFAVPGSDISKYLVESSDGSPVVKRQSQVALFPNTTTYASTNLPFLFLQPDLPSDKLCKTCTRNVLTSYINFEANMPYGPGIANSMMLQGQRALYDGVQKTCGEKFLSGTVSAAGGISGGVLGNGSPKTLSMAAESIFGVVTALAFGLAAVF